MDELLKKRAELQKIVHDDEKRLRQSACEFGILIKKKMSLGKKMGTHPYRWLIGALSLGIWLGYKPYHP